MARSRTRRPLRAGWEVALAASGEDRVATDRPSPPPPHDDRWRPVAVPGFWQRQIPGRARATGAVWYRVVVELGADELGPERLVLAFGAVSHFCQGWVNRTYVGEHEGGHLPFEWPIDGPARAGTNEVLLRVVTPSGDRTRYPAFPFEETLHGKQSWYGPLGGIWQDVVVEARSASAVRHVAVRPDPERDRVDVAVTLVEGAHPDARVRLELLDPDGAACADTWAVPGRSVTVACAHGDVRRWSPDDPSLYRVRATVVVDGATVDTAEQRFGFRTFGSVDGRFHLNDEPFLMRGVLDQDYHEGPGVATTKEEILDLFATVKAMGFNTIRCHIKVPDPRYLDAADEVGLLLWCELPMASRLTRAARKRIEDTLFAVLERDRHHPSIVMWSIANESWGLELTANPEHREWLVDLVRRTKAAVPGRLVVDNSPCWPNFHLVTDVNDYHFYAVVPQMRERWDSFIASFAARDPFTFSPHGDARPSGDEPLVVSEFGTWGLPDLTVLADDEPWWFESGQEWADGAAYVHGAPERARLWHLDSVFGDWESLCLETQRSQFETMRYQIETIRSRPELAGYVLTELSDVHWEANGLLDATRRPRSFVDRLRAFNGATAIVPTLDHGAVWADRPVEVALTAVNGAAAQGDVELRTQVTACDGAVTVMRTALGRLGPHERVELDPLVVPVGPCTAPSSVGLRCDLVVDEVSIASTDRTVLVLPDTAPPPTEHPLVVADSELRSRLAELGHVTTGEVSSGGLRVLHRLTPEDDAFVRSGGTALLLAEDVEAFGDGFDGFPAVRLEAWRDALPDGGEWVSAFSWLRRTGQFADLPGGPLMDLAFEGLSPEIVITGIPPARYEYDVLAGVFVGWVHHVAAIVAAHHVGLGTLLVSTLGLTRRPPGADAMATWLLRRLVATAQERP